MQIGVGDLSFTAQVAGPPDGRAVLLLHGFPQSARCWSRVSPLLTAAGLRTIAPDQRGYSPGARPADVSSYAMPELVADVIGMLDALDLPAVDLVGHDWGALVGWYLAADHPERVRSLVAISVPHPLAVRDALVSDLAQPVRFAYVALFRLEGTAERVLLSDDAKRLRRVFTGSGLSDAEIAGYVEPLRAPGALTAALSWYRAFSRHDLGAVGPVSVPTTFVWSDGDLAIGRTAAAACERHVTGPYRFVELAGVSHWVPEQAPEAVASAVVERVAAA